MINEQLVVLIRAHENEAENMLQLWKQNKGLIAMIAKKYSQYAEMEDLDQEGYIGLCNAVQHYDSSKGVLFSSYATFWIKQVITRYIDNCCHSIRVPVHVINDVRRYKRTISEFQKYNGYMPSRNEIKTLLGGIMERITSNRRKHKNERNNELRQVYGRRYRGNNNTRYCGRWLRFRRRLRGKIGS